jgi:hypothetical protein
MQKILGFAGLKQSGKSSCCNFLHGYLMKIHDCIDEFDLTSEGGLIVNSVMVNEKGDQEDTMGLLDVERDDYEFAMWAANSMWPFVKSYSFAKPLKDISIGLFDLTYEQCYGSDKDKNTPVPIRWDALPGYKGKKKGFMTAREFMQYLGTDIFRAIKNDIWSKKCIAQILDEGSDFAIVSDCRFPNETKAIKDAGGKIVKLTRNSADEDDHCSETALKTFKDYDAVIDNQDLKMIDTHKRLIELLFEWGWLQTKTESIGTDYKAVTQINKED